MQHFRTFSDEFYDTHLRLKRWNWWGCIF